MTRLRNEGLKEGKGGCSKETGEAAGGKVEKKFLVPAYSFCWGGTPRGGGGGGRYEKNSIAFGTAPRREVDSQPISS